MLLVVVPEIIVAVNIILELYESKIYYEELVFLQGNL